MSEDVEELKQVVEQLNGPPGRWSFSSAILAPLARLWWLELALGVFWLVISVVVLKFNHASVVTVGVLIGLMFLVFAAEEFVLAALDDGASKWLWGLFGVLLLAGGVVSLLHPRKTFAGFADILGFVFLLIGVIWMVQSVAESAFNSLWWLGLISGMLMIVLAFWTSGQFYLQRAYTLLIFAGIWALMKGITDIVRAFQLSKLAPG